MDYSDPCCNVQGGVIEFIVNGVPYSTTGDVVVYPSRYESEHQANNDGSMSVQKTPKVPSAEITLRSHCAFDPSELTEQCTLDVVIRQPTAKKRYMFPKAAIVGDPQMNLQSGEVSGLMVASPHYKQRSI
jgi:hypothetical protein